MTWPNFCCQIQIPKQGCVWNCHCCWYSGVRGALGVLEEVPGGFQQSEERSKFLHAHNATHCEHVDVLFWKECWQIVSYGGPWHRIISNILKSGHGQIQYTMYDAVVPLLSVVTKTDIWCLPGTQTSENSRSTIFTKCMFWFMEFRRIFFFIFVLKTWKM